MKDIDNWLNSKELAVPEMALDDDFGLNDPSTNKAQLLDLQNRASAKKLRTVVSRGHKLTVYGSGQRSNSGVYWIPYAGKLIWLVKFKAFTLSWLPNGTITQVKLWRNTTTDVLSKNFTTDMFFKFLLQEHGSIMSDRLHTQAGRRFWEIRLMDAFDRKYNVGLADFHARTLQRISTYDEAGELFPKVWGNKMVNQSLRWVIWK